MKNLLVFIVSYETLVTEEIEGELQQRYEKNCQEVPSECLVSFLNQLHEDTQNIKIIERKIIDVCTEEDIAELQQRVSELEDENEQLNEKCENYEYQLDKVADIIDNALSNIEDAQYEMENAKDECSY